jgi:hypothetical protein
LHFLGYVSADYWYSLGMTRLPLQIVLIGPMCIGKTAIAKILSKKISNQAISLDEELSDFPQVEAWKSAGASTEEFEKLRQKFERTGFSEDPSTNYCMFKDQVNRLYEPVIFAKFTFVLARYSECILDTGSNLQVQSSDHIKKNIIEKFNERTIPVVLRYSPDHKESYGELWERFLKSPRANWLSDGLYSKHWQHFLKETIEAPLLYQIAKAGIDLWTKGTSPEYLANQVLAFLKDGRYSES